MTLYMCVNYGGRAEIIDAVRAIAEDARAGRISGRGITARSLARHLDDPDMPDVDLVLRTRREQRPPNFLLGPAAHAETEFVAEDARAGRISGRGITARSFARHLDDPDMPDVDLFLRTSGEQRTSNFLLWQAAYAELVFVPELWPDVDRRVLWRAITEYARRD